MATKRRGRGPGVCLPPRSGGWTVPTTPGAASASFRKLPSRGLGPGLPTVVLPELHRGLRAASCLQHRLRLGLGWPRAALSVCLSVSQSRELLPLPTPQDLEMVTLGVPGFGSRDGAQARRAGRRGQQMRPCGSYQLLAPGAARPRLDAVPAGADLVLGALLGEGWGDGQAGEWPCAHPGLLCGLSPGGGGGHPGERRESGQRPWPHRGPGGAPSRPTLGCRAEAQENVRATTSCCGPEASLGPAGALGLPGSVRPGPPSASGGLRAALPPETPASGVTPCPTHQDPGR